MATVLVAAAGAVTLALVSGWGWPLIGDARAGGVAVLVIGFAASVTGGGPDWLIAALRPHGTSGMGMAFTVVASILGFAAFGLLVADLVVNSLELVVLATVALGALWVFATIHHSIESTPALRQAGLTAP